MERQIERSQNKRNDLSLLALIRARAGTPIPTGYALISHISSEVFDG
jgi:hypothetical protein